MTFRMSEIEVVVKFDHLVDRTSFITPLQSEIISRKASSRCVLGNFYSLDPEEASKSPSTPYVVETELITSSSVLIPLIPEQTLFGFGRFAGSLSIGTTRVGSTNTF